MNLVDELVAVSAILTNAAIPFAICGGVAVTIHGATRTTKGIDLLVRREDVPRILDWVRPLGYVFVALPMTFDAGTPRERHVQRVSKVEGAHHLVLDLMIAEGVLAGLLDDRLAIELPSGTISIVSRDALIRMKRIAGRPQDLADIEKLEGNHGHEP